MNERALAAADRVDAGKVIDTTALVSDLSHQLEESRGKIEAMEVAIRNLRETLTRVEGARDALRELLVEAMK
jgi:hypothetical protein